VLYKVVLVEDEIVAREGIRDNVDWLSVGFKFCGEAADGEMALPLLESTRPDVLITDIKMPFMDGLQLCKVVRERLPWVKIVILSGHDEFHYAQEALKLGVTEYLLKPVGVQDLHEVLQKVAGQLDQERQEQEVLQKLKNQVADNLSLRREKFLLQLVMGDASSLEAIQQSRQLELDIIARWYQATVIKAELCGPAEQFDFHQFQQVERIVAGLVQHNPDVFLLKKDLDELVLIIKGDSRDHVTQEAYFLTGLIKNEVEASTNCLLRVGLGAPQERLSDIHRSFAQALAMVQQVSQVIKPGQAAGQTDKAELLKLDKVLLENYLKFGSAAEFETFFAAYLRPLSQAALDSYLVKNYIFIDLVLTTAKFVHRLGGVVDQVIPEINSVETLLLNIKTVEQIRVEARKICASALAFRDSQANNQHVAVTQAAKTYISDHFANPDLSLHEVAAHVNVSASHFSAVFSRETGETFKEYLTGVRIKKAKELLKTTSLKTFEIAYQVGYKDPHYFSAVFKKQTGLSPSEFRL
jgi:two-component system response regulator YesN